MCSKWPAQILQLFRLAVNVTSRMRAKRQLLVFLNIRPAGGDSEARHVGTGWPRIMTSLGRCSKSAHRKGIAVAVHRATLASASEALRVRFGNDVRGRRRSVDGLDTSPAQWRSRGGSAWRLAPAQNCPPVHPSVAYGQTTATVCPLRNRDLHARAYLCVNTF